MTPKELAEEYADAQKTLRFSPNAFIWARIDFLAGYNAAKAEVEAYDEELNDTIRGKFK